MVVGNSFLTRSGRPFSTLQRKVGTRETFPQIVGP